MALRGDPPADRDSLKAAIRALVRLRRAQRYRRENCRNRDQPFDRRPRAASSRSTHWFCFVLGVSNARYYAAHRAALDRGHRRFVKSDQVGRRAVRQSRQWRVSRARSIRSIAARPRSWAIKPIPTLADVPETGRPRLHRAAAGARRRGNQAMRRRQGAVRPASSPPDSPRRAKRAAPTRTACARSPSQSGLLHGRPKHDRHGQCRLRHDGKLREFPALGKGRRVVLHPDRHLHRRGDAARDERGNPAPAGVEKHRRRQQDRRRRSRLPEFHQGRSRRPR